MKKLILLFFFSLSCLFMAQNAIAQQMSRKEYIEHYKDIAVRQMNLYGIPASIIMAQACLESGNGNSRLAVKANNHFGIKCHNWNGKTFKHDDDKKKECFRKYNSAEDSFKDHSEFLKSGQRYAFLFSYSKTDYKSWAHGLKKAGYATNPKYAEKLIEIIEEYNLSSLDSPLSAKADKKKSRDEKRAERKRQKEELKKSRELRKSNSTSVSPHSVVGNEVADTPDISNVAVLNPVPESSVYDCSLERVQYKNNGAKYVISLPGESYESIADNYNLFLREILGFNDIDSNTRLESGSIVYITSKRNRGQERTYVVQDGETLYIISQKKGIKLKKLYLLNSFDRDEPIKAGTIIYLK